MQLAMSDYIRYAVRIGDMWLSCENYCYAKSHSWSARKLFVDKESAEYMATMRGGIVVRITRRFGKVKA